MNKDYLLKQDEFIRHLKIDAQAPYALLTGAGASVSSGIPSAKECIWNWKKEIYLSNNIEKTTEVNDISLPQVQNQIQNWIDIQPDYPKNNSDVEYSFYIEKTLRIPEARNKFFQSYISKSKPNIGYKLLALLLESSLINSLWTTNFDDLPEKAFLALNNKQKDLIKVSHINNTKISPQRSSNEVLYTLLHGDYKYDAIQNTTTELQSLEQEYIDTLKEQLKYSNLIVCGYSGRDNSIMKALLEVYSNNGTGKLFWCGYGNDDYNDNILELLSIARKNNRNAFYVPINGFDDFMYNISAFCLDNSFKDEFNKIKTECRNNCESAYKPFSLDVKHISNLIKSNAFPIQLPAEAFQFEADNLFKNGGTWKKLKDILKGHSNIVAVPQHRKIIAIGTLSDIKQAFNKEITSNISRTPITLKDIKIDGVINNLFKQAITIAIAKTHNLDFNEKTYMIWKKESTNYSILKNTYKVFDAIELSIKVYNKEPHLIIEPTIYATDLTGERVPFNIKKELSFVILKNQYNKQYNDKLNEWRKLFFPQRITKIEFPIKSSSPFLFSIDNYPMIAGIYNPKNQRLSGIFTTNNLGVQLEEPYLLFKDNHNNLKKEINPIRGITEYNPIDYGLQDKTTIKIGVLVPSQYKDKLTHFLETLNNKIDVNSKKEYLVDYKGFQNIFKTNIKYSIQEIEDIGQTLPIKEGALNIRDNITKGINQFCLKNKPDLLMIFIPKSWKKYEYYLLEGEKFDLHNNIKAFCVKQNLPSQFIRESTLEKKNISCEIAWWLSLSLYIKSYRTPWLLNNMDSDTLFMGLGYSLNTIKDRDNQIIFGCSHLYNYQGLDLGYKLNKIENPIIKQRTPFLSKDDAYKIAQNAIYLFTKNMRKQPKRIVIHKRNHYLEEEKEGFLEAFKNIENVDMIEINNSSKVKFVDSNIYNNKITGKASFYPVNRGTTVLIDEDKAFLWLHGNTIPLPSGKNYFKGKSRIPAPLFIKKHHGSSNLTTVANEILALSKVSWNSFDFYSKLPATLESSTTIAQIADLLERTDESYDYRLFI